MHLVVENKCVNIYLHLYSLFLYHQKNLGGPGSSRGTLERIRAGLTIYIADTYQFSSVIVLEDLVYICVLVAKQKFRLFKIFGLSVEGKKIA